MDHIKETTEKYEMKDSMESMKDSMESMKDSMEDSIISEFFKEYKYEILVALIIFFALVIFFNRSSFKLHRNNRHKIDIYDILKNNYYINLDYRTDRKESIINELNKIGIKSPNRFNAIKNEKGAIGCSMSHLKVIKLAKENNWDYVVVFEDDVIFLKPEETLKKLDNIVNSNINWDVIILGGNNNIPYEIINEDCIKVNNCQCCSSYIVKKSYYDVLINYWTDGLDKLIKTNDYPKYACDVYWKILQRKDIFLLITPVNVVQREDYSDIEKKNVNYINLMVNIDS